MGLWCSRDQKNFEVNNLPLERSLADTNVNLKSQTWRQGPGQVTSWRSRLAGNAENLNLKVSNNPHNQQDINFNLNL